MKKIISMILMMTMLPLSSVKMNAAFLPIVLHCGYNDPTENQGKPHRGPDSPELSIDGYVLQFDTPCDGYTLNIVNGDYVYLTLQESAKITFHNTSTGVVDTFYGTSVTYPDAPNLRICVSAHNKIPMIIDNGVLYLQNEEIASSLNYEADEIRAGINVTIAKSPGDVIFTGGNSVLKGKTVELRDNTTITAGAHVEIKN